MTKTSHRTGLRARIAAVTAAIVACTCAIAIAASSYSEAQRRLDVAMGRLEDAAASLALNKTLDKHETDSLREQLADVYAELEEVRALLAEDQSPGPVVGQRTWVQYKNATLDASPPDAKFGGWSKGFEVSSSFGTKAGEINVYVSNGKYRADWLIRDAYTGNVKAKVSTEQSGDVLLKLTDELGEHWFRIANGGLGPIYISGKSGPGKTTQPIPPVKSVPESGGGQGEAPAGKWFQAYRNQVRDGQISESKAMEWFIDQANRYDYESDALRDLGQACKQLEGEEAVDRVGRLMYYSAGKPVKMPIPDPRVNPVEFVHAVNKAYILEQGGEWYEVSLDLILE